MTFDEALKHLRAGATVRRLLWKGHVIGISIAPGRAFPNHRNQRQPFVALRCGRDDGSIQAKRWTPYASDFTADDWSTVVEDLPWRQMMVTQPDLPGIRKVASQERFDVRPGKPGHRCGCCRHFDGRDKCWRSLSMVTDDEVCDGFELTELR
jgi:hypothetical protein